MAERRKNVTDETKAAKARHPFPRSHPSPEGFIPPHGGCEKLFSYPKSQIIYDATVRFCDRFIDKKSRTTDQMVQAEKRKRGQSIVWIVLLAKHQKLGLNIEPDTPTIARAMPTNIKTSVTF